MIQSINDGKLWQWKFEIVFVISLILQMMLLHVKTIHLKIKFKATPYLVEFLPPDDHGNQVQRTFRTIGAITGEYLSTVYAQMLHSDETLSLEGFRIRVQAIGTVMRRGRVVGGARSLGSKHIPKDMKNRGLGQHPDYNSADVKDVPCGTIAFLLGSGLHLLKPYKKSWESLVFDASMLASLIGVEGRFMRNEQFDDIVKLPDHLNVRIIIYRNDKEIEYVATGSEWEIGQSRSTPDPNTVYIMRDLTWDKTSRQPHYYWIQTINTVAFEKMNHSQIDCTDCYVCMQPWRTEKFGDHICNDIRFFQCRICKRYFSSQAGLDMHYSLKNENYKCEICERKMFYGPGIF